MYPSRYNPSAIKLNQDWIQGSKCHTELCSVAIKILLLIQCSTRTESQTLNATQGHKHSYQQTIYIYRSQMMVTIQPGYMSTQGFSASMSHKDTIHTATILWLTNATTKGAILLAIDVNTETSNQLINVSTRTRSTRPQSCD